MTEVVHNEIVVSLREAYDGEKETVPLKESEGRISGEFLYLSSARNPASDAGRADQPGRAGESSFFPGGRAFYPGTSGLQGGIYRCVEKGQINGKDFLCDGKKFFGKGYDFPGTDER